MKEEEIKVNFLVFRADLSCDFCNEINWRLLQFFICAGYIGMLISRCMISHQRNSCRCFTVCEENGDGARGYGEMRNCEFSGDYTYDFIGQIVEVETKQTIHRCHCYCAFRSDIAAPIAILIILIQFFE